MTKPGTTRTKAPAGRTGVHRAGRGANRSEHVGWIESFTARWGPNGIMRELATRRERVRRDLLEAADTYDRPGQRRAGYLQRLADDGLDDLTTLGILLGAADYTRLWPIFKREVLSRRIHPPTLEERKPCWAAIERLAKSELWQSPELRCEIIDAARWLELPDLPPTAASHLYDDMPPPVVAELARAVHRTSWGRLHPAAWSALMGTLAPGITPRLPVLTPPRPTSLTEYINAADDDLDPPKERQPEEQQPSPSEAERARVLSRFAGLMVQGMYDAPLETIRRALKPDHPFLTRTYAEKNVYPDLCPVRSIDQYGEEADFQLALRVSRYMLMAEPGTTYGDVQTHFRTEDLSAEVMGRDAARFRLSRLGQLQLTYGFVPRWERGTKGEGDLKLFRTEDRFRPEEVDYRTWKRWKAVSEKINKLGAVELRDELHHNLFTVRRAYLGLLDGASILKNTVVCADSIASTAEIMKHHRIAGDLIEWLLKNYAGDPEDGAEILRRALAIRMSDELLDSDAKARDRMIDAVEQAIDAWREYAAAPLGIHLEGSRDVFEAMRELCAPDPNTLVFASAHSTGDVLDAKEGESDLLVKETGGATSKHEAEKFRQVLVFQKIHALLEEKLKLPLQHFKVLIRGHGNIGASAAEAAKAAFPDRVVEDTDEAAMARALDEGLKPAPKEVTDPCLLIASTARKEPLPGAIEFSRFKNAKTLVLLSYGSGQREFDIDYLEKNNISNKPVEVEKLGRMTVNYYELDLGGKKPLKVYAVANGYPGNLPFLEPSPAAYAGVTSLIAHWSMWEAADELARGVSGNQPLRGVEVWEHSAPEAPATVLAFGPMGRPPTEEGQRPTEWEERWLDEFGHHRPYVQEFFDSDGHLFYVAGKQG